MNLNEAINEDPQWQSTVLRLTDLGYLWEERLECAEQHALPLTSHCYGTIDMVVDASSGDPEAEVVYARSGAVSDILEEADPCTSYVQCLAASRVGSRLPVPPHLVGTGLVPMSLESMYVWTSPVMLDKSKVAELIEFRKENLAVATQQGTQSDYEHLRETRLIAYLEQHLSRLRGDL